MGRLGRDFSQRPKKGKGRKSKKQPPPEFPGLDIQKELGKTALRRQKKREVRKLAKQLSVVDTKKSKAKDFEENPRGDIDWLPEDIDDPDASYQEVEDDNAKRNETNEENVMDEISEKPMLPGLEGGDSDISQSDDDPEDAIEIADDFFPSQDHSGDSEEMESDDELDIEKDSRKLVKKQQKIREMIDQSESEQDSEDEIEAEDMEQPEDGSSDMELNIEDSAEKSEKLGQVLSHDELLERIHSNLDAFRDPKGKAAQGRKRSDVRAQLVGDLSTYYGYNEFLIEKFLDLFPGETLEALDANEIDRPMTIRANTLLTRRRDLAQALLNRGVNLDTIGEWSQLGLVIFDSKIPIGATPEYLAGQYIIQGGSSLLPVMALDPKENERVLDLCAAPGGKTTHIAQLMRNTGSIIANDIHKDRCTALAANCHRMAVTNTAVSCLDGRQIPKLFNDFDRVLLDAPCSGTGVISKDPSCKTIRDEKDIKRTAHVQRELLIAAIDSCDAKRIADNDGSEGGVIVYSTCSILVEENEDVVAYALRKRCVKLVDTGLEFGEDGFTSFGRFKFPPQIKLCKRYYPHTNNLDGFFVAKLVKYANDKKQPKLDPTKVDDDIQQEDGFNSEDESGHKKTTKKQAEVKQKARPKVNKFKKGGVKKQSTKREHKTAK